MEQRLYPEAESLLGPAYEAIRSQIGEQHSDTRVVRRLIFDLYTKWDRPEDARRFTDDPSDAKGDRHDQANP